MADNYLERKMDDLRGGRLSARPLAASSPRKGMFSVPFPPRRVAVAGIDDTGLAVARSFLKAGCRVALFFDDAEEGTRLAHDEGFRFHRVDVSDPPSVETAFLSLADAWRDVDIVVDNTSGCSVATLIRRLWTWRRRRLPDASGYRSRMMMISRRKTRCPSGAPAFPDDPEEGSGIATQRIFIDEMCPDGISGIVGRLCLFLALPGNECIKNTCI